MLRISSHNRSDFHRMFYTFPAKFLPMFVYVEPFMTVVVKRKCGQGSILLTFFLQNVVRQVISIFPDLIDPKLIPRKLVITSINRPNRLRSCIEIEILSMIGVKEILLLSCGVYFISFLFLLTLK